MLATPVAGVDDLELTRRYLAHTVVEASGQVAAAEDRAARAVVPATPTPRLAIGREQTFGDGGGAATAVGIELDLDASGRAGLAREAGALRAAAAPLERRATLVEGVCEVRGLGVAARAADEQVVVLESTQAALEALGREIAQLVRGRERAAFDAERVRLRVATHARRLRSARAEAQGARAALSAWVGRVDGPLRVEPAEPDSAFEALSGHQGLAALDRRVAAARARRAVGDRWWVPGVGLYGAWRREAPERGAAAQGYEAGLTIDLPFVDRGEPERARADAERVRLEAARARIRARAEAEISALRGTLGALSASSEAPEVDLEALVGRARLRYREGVGPLAELLDALDAVEAARLADRAVDARRRALRLGLACVAGAFPEPEIDRLLQEATR